MVVSFPFTFSFSIPGIANPFSTHLSRSQPQARMVRPGNYLHPELAQFVTQDGEPNMAVSHHRLRNSPSPSITSIAKAKNLKRGWEPAFVEPSQSTATLASTTGYLDTPSKYREMANAVSARDQSEELPPPSKKRRGLTGSIVSTAVSAALIGTAVGFTVYRLWRDRGKEQPKPINAATEFGSVSTQQLPPPPPYQEREWTPVSHPSPTPEAAAAPALLPPPTPRRKVHRHSVKRPRRARVQRIQVVASPPRAGAAGSSAAYVPRPEFDFERDGEAEAEDQMDWIGDKLARLIEEGKRALSREVVVMSDAKEDEVDDGTGAWEEEEEEDRENSSGSNAAKRGANRPRSRGYGSPKPSTHHLPLPPATSTRTTTPGRTHTRGFSTESITRDLVKEDETTWQSPELKESMQKARDRILAGRGAS